MTSKNSKAKREARARQRATGEPYTLAWQRSQEAETEEGSVESPATVGAPSESIKRRAYFEEDDDSGYGPDSYFAHAMAKDD